MDTWVIQGLQLEELDRYTKKPLLLSARMRLGEASRMSLDLGFRTYDENGSLELTVFRRQSNHLDTDIQHPRRLS